MGSLNLSDLGETLRVRGKGRKTREVPVSRGMRSWLDAWLEIRGDEPGPLFYQTRSKAGDVIPERMSDKAIRRVVAKRARQAGVQDIASHDLRRTAVTLLLESGADLALAQRLAGHTNPATTSRYDRRGEEALRKAMQRRRYPGLR